MKLDSVLGYYDVGDFIKHENEMKLKKAMEDQFHHDYVDFYSIHSLSPSDVIKIYKKINTSHDISIDEEVSVIKSYKKYEDDLYIHGGNKSLLKAEEIEDVLEDESSSDEDKLRAIKDYAKVLFNDTYKSFDDWYETSEEAKFYKEEIESELSNLDKIGNNIH